MQLVLPDSSRGRQSFENARKPRVHEYVILRTPPRAKRTEVFASTEGASGESLVHITYFYAERHLFALTGFGNDNKAGSLLTTLQNRTLVNTDFCVRHRKQREDLRRVEGTRRKFDVF